MIVRISRSEVLRGHDNRDTRGITRTVALLAICVFTISGSQILPPIIDSAGHGVPVAPGMVSAFLLNVALILFAWRRSEQLRKTAEERNAAEDMAYKLAYFDELTGLLNRRRLEESLTELCSGPVGKGALILLDLDRFKRVNDLHGHPAGDRVLSVAAQRIRDNCPPEASCFRLGGDEFAIVLEGVSAQPKVLERVAAMLLEELLEPICIGATTTAVAASIGIATVTRNCRKPAMLLERADFAMYEAKRRGRGRYQIFNLQMEAELDQRRKFEIELQEGVESGQFVPYFQPIFDLVSRDVTGFEVLARWKHPTRGLLEPTQFIETAERMGLLSDLSFKVMLEALSIARGWPARFKICVNVSAVQFSDPLLAQRILQVLSRTGFPPQRLEVEIAEKSLLEDLPMALSIIASLKNSGISVSVDDFGIGYEPLSELKSVPFDRIKIDRSYVAALLDESRSDAVAEAISTLGKGHRVPITAEGVEADSLRSRLLELGCTDAQGWVFAQALSAKEVVLGFGGHWERVVPGASQDPAATIDERKTAGL